MKLPGRHFLGSELSAWNIKVLATAAGGVGVAQKAIAFHFGNGQL
jgi:hypothetical protein